MSALESLLRLIQVRMNDLDPTTLSAGALLDAVDLVEAQRVLMALLRIVSTRLAELQAMPMARPGPKRKPRDKKRPKR